MSLLGTRTLENILDARKQRIHSNPFLDFTQYGKLTDIPDVLSVRPDDRWKIKPLDHSLLELHVSYQDITVINTGETSNLIPSHVSFTLYNIKNNNKMTTTFSTKCTEEVGVFPLNLESDPSWKKDIVLLVQVFIASSDITFQDLNVHYGWGHLNLGNIISTTEVSTTISVQLYKPPLEFIKRHLNLSDLLNPKELKMINSHITVTISKKNGLTKADEFHTILQNLSVPTSQYWIYFYPTALKILDKFSYVFYQVYTIDKNSNIHKDVVQFPCIETPFKSDYSNSQDNCYSGPLVWQRFSPLINVGFWKKDVIFFNEEIKLFVNPHAKVVIKLYGIKQQRQYMKKYLGSVTFSLDSIQEGTTEHRIRSNASFWITINFPGNFEMNHFLYSNQTDLPCPVQTLCMMNETEAKNYIPHVLDKLWMQIVDNAQKAESYIGELKTLLLGLDSTHPSILFQYAMYHFCNKNIGEVLLLNNTSLKHNPEHEGILSYYSFISQIIVKSLILWLHHEGKLGNRRHLDNDLKISLLSWANILIEARAVQITANLINDLFGFADRGFVFHMFHQVMLQLSSDFPVNSMFQFLDMITSYEHFVPLNLPLYHPVRLASTLKLNWWKHHYLTGYLFDFYSKNPIGGLLVLKILWKHSMDPRYSSSDPSDEATQYIANCYLPILSAPFPDFFNHNLQFPETYSLFNYKHVIEKMASTLSLYESHSQLKIPEKIVKEDLSPSSFYNIESVSPLPKKIYWNSKTKLQFHARPKSDIDKHNSPRDRHASLTKTSKKKMEFKKRAIQAKALSYSHTLCFFYVLGHCQKKILEEWWLKETSENLVRFLKTLSRCVDLVLLRKKEVVLSEFCLTIIETLEQFTDIFKEQLKQQATTDWIQIFDTICTLFVSCITKQAKNMCCHVFQSISEFILAFQENLFRFSPNLQFLQSLIYQLISVGLGMDDSPIVNDAFTLYSLLIKTNYEVCSNLELIQGASKGGMEFFSKQEKDSEKQGGARLVFVLEKIVENLQQIIPEQPEGTVESPLDSSQGLSPPKDFNSQLLEIVGQLKMLCEVNEIAKDVSHLEELAEIYRKIAEDSNIPKTRFTWLSNLGQLHLENNNLCESSQVELHKAWLLLSWLKSKNLENSEKLGPLFPFLEATLDKLARGARFQTPLVYSLDPRTPAVPQLCRCLKRAAEFSKIFFPSVAATLYSMIIAINTANENYKEIQNIVSSEVYQKALMDAQTKKEKVHIYHFVAFFGAKWNQAVSGRSFIYKSEQTEKIWKTRFLEELREKLFPNQIHSTSLTPTSAPLMRTHTWTKTIPSSPSPSHPPFITEKLICVGVDYTPDVLEEKQYVIQIFQVFSRNDKQQEFNFADTFIYEDDTQKILIKTMHKFPFIETRIQVDSKEVIPKGTNTPVQLSNGSISDYRKSFSE